MKQKILICSNTLQYGGSERVISNLLPRLNKHFEIHLALYYNISSYSIPDDVKVIYLTDIKQESFGSFLFRAKESSKKLYRYCKDNEIPVVVAFLNRAFVLAALLKWHWKFTGKVIMFQRTHATTLAAKENWLNKKLQNFITKWCLKKADVVLANSVAIKKDLEANYLPGTKVRVIVNPIELDKVQERTRAPLQVVFNAEYFHVVVVAGLRKEKDHLGILKACQFLETLPIKIWFVGGGQLEEMLKQEAKNLKVDQMVEFVGFTPNPFPYIYHSHLALLNSYVEGFPNAILEAMACGKAVVSTDCMSGPREILTTPDEATQKENGYEIGTCGILTPVNDPYTLAKAVERLFKDKELRIRMEKCAVEKVKNYDIERLKQQFIEAFSVIPGN